MILSFFRVNGNIIYVYNDIIMDQALEIYVHSSIESGSYAYSPFISPNDIHLYVNVLEGVQKVVLS